MYPFNFRKNINLKNPLFTCVKVPVLSEKMYSICPSSSLSVVVLALAGVSVLE